MTRSETETEARLDDLEARLAHQDQAVIELGDEVYRQQRLIAQLETILRGLAERLSTFDQAGSAAEPADEAPPHY